MTAPKTKTRHTDREYAFDIGGLPCIVIFISDSRGGGYIFALDPDMEPYAEALEPHEEPSWACGRSVARRVVRRCMEGS